MVRDLLISLVPNQVSVFNFKTHPSTYRSTSGSLFWAIHSFNYGLLWYWRQSCVESIHRHSLLQDGYFCTWPSYFGRSIPLIMVFYGIEDKAVLNPYTGIAYFKMGIFAPGLLVHLSYWSVNLLGGQTTNTEQLVTFVRLIFRFTRINFSKNYKVIMPILTVKTSKWLNWGNF